MKEKHYKHKAKTKQKTATQTTWVKNRSVERQLLIRWDKIRFYCPIKVPARGRVITVIYITQNILIHKCNKQYTNKQFAEIRLVHKY